MTALREALAAFDEAVLVTLANVGLYRRAVRDVAEGKAALVEMAGDGAIVIVDGQRVAIDARGPKAADCACKAPGICRHRLAAVLLLKGLAPTAGDDTAPETANPRDAVDPVDPVEMLTPFAPALLERWTGKAAWRTAREIAGGTAVVRVENTALTVAFAAPAPVVRILRGQGLDGIVSKAAPARQKPLHAAAVLAARRHFGLAVPEQAMPSPAETAGPALPEPAFLRQIEAALGDCALFAFNLAPEPVEEQLFALSVSSHADALPRLGRLLRTLAAQMQLKRERAFSFDHDRCLEMLATAYALVRALAGANVMTAPARLHALCGAYRQTFVPQRPLQLVGCGADLWRTEAGTRGVSGIFYEPRGDRWLTCAHARAPGQDPRFDPAQAYASAAVWSGFKLRQLGGASFTLEGVGVSPSGRLSNPAGAKALVDAKPVDRSTWRARFDDWPALEMRLASRFGLGLTGRIGRDFVVLAPQRYAPPYFDDLTQTLVWPIEDAHARWLALTLPYGDDTAPIIERIENCGECDWRGEIVVRASQNGDRYALTPIAIFEAGGPISLALDHDLRSEREEPPCGDVGLHSVSTLHGGGHGFVPAPPDATAKALSDLWQRLINLAESGLERVRPTALDGLRRSVLRLEPLGYTALADRISMLVQHPRRDFLAAAYAVLTARRQRARLPMLRLL